MQGTDEVGALTVLKSSEISASCGVGKNLKVSLKAESQQLTLLAHEGHQRMQGTLICEKK